MKTVNNNYEIETRSDFLTGMYLITRIADSDVDENALSTIKDDCPDFLLPFNHVSINGQTEFTYKVGTFARLQYFYGEVSHAEYIALWKSILSPLLECKDWFMKPSSFVLSTDYLYYDKEKRSIAYVYIPSLVACSGSDAFNEMAIEVAKNIKVSDPVLENKVLRSIVNDFNPGDFLKMLLEHLENEQARTGSILQKAIERPWESFEAPERADADMRPVPFEKEESPVQESVGRRLFGGKNRKAGESKRSGFKNTIPASVLVGAPLARDDKDEATQETKAVMSGTGLRCVGQANFPQYIEVQIEDGELFTIGRYDVNAGKKRSSFEFHAKTKAVSRRHAVIERIDSTYNIVDLASSAGTFVNDKKIPPNTPVNLEPGARVSFGNMGADYVWDKS